MGQIVNKFNDVYADGLAGLPLQPEKRRIREIGPIIEQEIDAERTARIVAVAEVDAKATQALNTVGTGAKGWLPSPIRLLTTSDVSPTTGMEAGDTFDGIVLQAGWIIAKAVPGGSLTNGIWIVPSSGAASRPSWGDLGDELELRSFKVTDGTHAKETWFIQTPDITLGSTAIEIVNIDSDPDYALTNELERQPFPNAVAYSGMDGGSSNPALNSTSTVVALTTQQGLLDLGFGYAIKQRTGAGDYVKVTQPDVRLKYGIASLLVYAADSSDISGLARPTVLGLPVGGGTAGVTYDLASITKEEILPNTWFLSVEFTFPNDANALTNLLVGIGTAPATANRFFVDAYLYVSDTYQSSIPIVRGKKQEWIARKAARERVAAAVSDVTAAILPKLGDVARPQDQTGPGDHLKIAQATATGKTVDLGGYTYTLTGSLGNFGQRQTYLGRGAVINHTNNSLMVSLSTETDIRGLTVIGAGSGSSNSAFRLPADKSGVSLDIKAFDMGGDAFQSINNAARYGSRLTGDFFGNERAIYFGERGEYTLVYGVAISAVAVNPGTSTKVGIDMVGGNNMVVGALITNMGTAFRVGYGANDAHTIGVGITANHNDFNFVLGPISTRSYVLNGFASYAGRFVIAGRGYLAMGGTFGSGGIEETSGGVYSTVMCTSFRHMPEDPAYAAAYGGYVPNSGGPSCVFYGWNDYPQTVLGNDPWRQVTARSKRKVSGNVTIATGTPAKLDFDTSLVNALHNNTAFSYQTLYSDSLDCWTPLTFASPFSTGRMEADIEVTIGKTGSFDDSAVDVYLSLQNNSGVEQERRYFSRSSNRADGGDNKRIFTFNGFVPKHYRMAVYVDNRSGGNITVYQDSQTEFPTVAEVRGW